MRAPHRENIFGRFCVQPQLFYSLSVCFGCTLRYVVVQGNASWDGRFKVTSPTRAVGRSFMHRNIKANMQLHQLCVSFITIQSINYHDLLIIYIPGNY